MPIFKSKTIETQLSQAQRGPSRVQSLGFASTEQPKVFLFGPPSHLFRVTAEMSDTSGQAPLGQPGHFLPQTSPYKAVSFRAWCHLPFGAERALSDCTSQPVGFPGAPPLETMAAVAPEGPACHLASWQTAAPLWKLNPIGMLQVLRAPGQGLKHRPRDSRATRSFSSGTGSHGVSRGLGPPEGAFERRQDAKPWPMCESRAGRGQGQAQGRAGALD